MINDKGEKTEHLLPVDNEEIQNDNKKHLT